MTSRVSCFNPAICKRNLRGTAPLWALYLLILFIVLPVQLLSIGSHTEHLVRDLQYVIFQCAHYNCSLASFLYGAAIAWVLNLYLFKTRSTNFYAALPIRRETMFLTNYLTGLLLGVLPNLLLCLLSIGATAMAGSVQLLASLQFFAISSLGYVFFFSFATLCCMMIGHIAAMPILYLVLNFTVYVIDGIIRNLLDAFVYGASGLPSILARYFSPLIHMLFAGRIGLEEITALDAGYTNTYYTVGYVYRGWSYLLILAAVGIVLAAAAFFLYRRREMERSGDVIAVKWLRPVFQYAFTFGCALVVGSLIMQLLGTESLSDNFLPVMLYLFLGAFLGYFAARMMLKKTLSVFKTGWLQLGICCLILLAGFGAARLDVFGYSARVPDASEVSSVWFDGYSNNGSAVHDPEVIAAAIELHQYLVDTKQEQESLLLAQYNGELGNSYSRSVSLRYNLTDGSQMIRDYSLAVSKDTANDPGSAIRRYESLCNMPAYVLAANTPSYELSEKSFAYCSVDGYLADAGTGQVAEYTTRALSSQQAYELYTTCIVPDLRDGTLCITNFTSDYASDSAETKLAENVSINVDMEFLSPYQGSDYYRYSVLPEAVRTTAYLNSLGFSGSN